MFLCFQQNRIESTGKSFASTEETVRRYLFARRCTDRRRRGGKLCPKPVVRPTRLHNLRDSAGSLLLGAGVQMAAVQRVLRHADPRITSERHAHLEQDYLGAEMRKLSLIPPSKNTGQTRGGATSEWAANRDSETPVIPFPSRERRTGFDPRPRAWEARPGLLNVPTGSWPTLRPSSRRQDGAPRRSQRYVQDYVRRGFRRGAFRQTGRRLAAVSEHASSKPTRAVHWPPSLLPTSVGSAFALPLLPVGTLSGVRKRTDRVGTPLRPKLWRLPRASGRKGVCAAVWFDSRWVGKTRMSVLLGSIGPCDEDSSNRRGLA